MWKYKFRWVENVAQCFNKKVLALGVGVIIGYHASIAQELSTLSQQKPVSLFGSVSAQTLAYGVSGIEPRRKPFSWMISLSPTLVLYGFTLPFSFTISEQERNFRQPFNQLGVSPSYKWATVHVGYRSVTFSPLTLAGYTFLGVGAELNPSIIRTGFIYGRFNRAVEEDTLDPEKDTPAFTRYGYSAKLGVGTKNNYVDLIMVKAWDDSNSLKSVPVQGEVFPGENLVIGTSSSLSFFKVLTFTFDAALSDFTRDLRADTLPGKANPVVGVLRPLLKPRTSTQLYTAVQAALNLQVKNFSMPLKYRRIDPDYKSMGAYYSENDAEGLSLSPSWQFFKQKLHFTGQVDVQQDNLLNRKLATTNRQQLSLTASVNPIPQFGFDLQYATFDTKQKPGQAALIDSLKLDQVNQSYGVTPRIAISVGRVAHFGTIFFTNQSLRDRNPKTQHQSATNSQTINIGYQLSLIPVALTFAPAVVVTNLTTSQNVSEIRGISFGVNQQLFKNAMGVNVSSSFAWNTTDGFLTSTTLTSRLQVTYRLKNRHSFNGNFNHTGNFARNASMKSFSEVEGGVGYDFTF